jgi:copper homeostasis protein
MSVHLLLEVCAFNLESCIIAERAGAGRIELCADHAAGGLTPSYELIQQVKQKLTIPIYPIIRPRAGDFLYTDDEFALMKEQIVRSKQLGCDGIVTGLQLPDGSIDTTRLKQLVALSHPLPVTCHRVFDRTPDPFKALEDIIASGCSRILTSGQKGNAADAIDLLIELITTAGNRIIIMPGGGVRSANIQKLISKTGASEFHTSAITDKTEMVDENELMKILYLLAAAKTDFIAQLYYFPPEKKGRLTQAFLGYRPHIIFEGYDARTSGKQIFVGVDKVDPGDSIKAEIKIAMTDFFRNKLYRGMKFSFYEGLHLIGSGEIIEIINKDLEK